MSPVDPEQKLDRVILLLLFGLLVFASPVREWWASGYSPWFTPYALWALVIALIAWLQRSWGSP